MQLYFSPVSPFVRKVRVTAFECGLDGRIELLPVETTAIATAEALARVNPLGKIPTLVRDDGPALYDSRVICHYLDALARRRLYPEGRIWEVQTLEALGDGIMEAAVLVVYERRFRDEDRQHEGWVAGQLARVTRALDALGERWMSHLGGPLDIGQIAVGCALGYLDFRHDDLGWREGRAELAGWYGRFAARPSMTATAPIG